MASDRVMPSVDPSTPHRPGHQSRMRGYRVGGFGSNLLGSHSGVLLPICEESPIFQRCKWLVAQVSCILGP